MTQQRRRSVRTIAAAIGMALGGAVLGLGVAPETASASSAEMTGWTCYETDSCHEGTSPCCANYQEIDPILGHCSTMCDGG
jgi:hypothetical protein